MYNRYINYRRDRESLVSLANFCLTILEDTADTRIEKKTKRQAAAHYYHISQKVLKRLAQLAAEKGDSEARKSKGVGNDLTEQERLFLEEAVKKMIYRAAEKVNDPAKIFSQITLSDLPPV